jgi:hypothetical protein
VIGIVLARRSRLLWFLVVAGLGALIMSFGPSLKVGDHRPAYSLENQALTYDMPASDATASLHTARLYEDVPGVNVMRATYRWYVLTRLVLILTAAVGVQRLLVVAGRSDRRVIYQGIILVTAAAAVVELMPPVRSDFDTYRSFDKQRQQLAALAGELDAAIPIDSRVAFTPNTPTDAANDYLAGYLVPLGDYESYNLGGDKSLSLAIDSWPPSVRNIIAGTNIEANVDQAFSTKVVDVVVVPRFDIRWSSYSWPPPASYVAAGDKIATQLESDPNVQVKPYQWFYIVTSAH